MELSIIIVSYNVKYFLHMCLQSLVAGTQNMESEIIVVDNASRDGSADMIRQYYPFVQLITNRENAGFGRACNQALDIAAGRYVLFINPDTLIGESLISSSLELFRNDENIGAVGVCLLDGNGEVLRESKRSIPTLWSAFTKFSGLSNLFKNSSFFNGYYAPELRYDESGEIEVLPGAFMLIRKKVLDEIKGFDPQFFMYAEDIDLSYRITQAGYRIWYEGSLQVIHFKGESTQKAKTSYTNTFFHSMQLFIRKYKEELYPAPVAGILHGIVGTIQWLQKVRYMLMGNKSNKKKHLPPVDGFVLTGKSHLKRALDRNHTTAALRVIPSKGSGRAPFYLRYVASWIATHPDTSIMIDRSSFSFDQIIQLWRLNHRGPFYIADSENCFFIGSHHKERQGEVYTFEVEGG